MPNTVRSLLFTAILVSSCSAEKVNLSPIADIFSKNKAKKENTSTTISPKETVAMVDYASEIEDLSSSFPHFGNSSLDREVQFLKGHLSKYIYAVKSGDINRKNKVYTSVKKSYSKIQTTAKFLNPDDKSVLDRYLTRIKSNLNFLENQISEDKAITSSNHD